MRTLETTIDGVEYFVRYSGAGSDTTIEHVERTDSDSGDDIQRQLADLTIDQIFLAAHEDSLTGD